jgi:hypothetical protein
MESISRKKISTLTIPGVVKELEQALEQFSKEIPPGKPVGWINLKL